MYVVCFRHGSTGGDSGGGGSGNGDCSDSGNGGGDGMIAIVEVVAPVTS